MPAHQAPCPPVPRRPLGGEGSRAWLILLAGQTTVHSSGWKECLDAQRLLPSRPLTTALTIAHAHKRRLALEVFLADRHVLIDTKRLERTLRLIPPKEIWMVRWTKLDAHSPSSDTSSKAAAG